MNLKQILSDVLAAVTRFNLTSLLVGIVIGGVAIGFVMQSRYEGYQLVHQSNIGGFVFMYGKIFNLTELHDDTYNNTPVKPTAKR
jgi:hypothetical protein